MTNKNMIVSVSDLFLSSEDKESTLNTIFFDVDAQSVEITMEGGTWPDYEKTILSIKNTVKNLELTTTIHPPVWDVNLASENLVLQKAAIDVHLKAFALANEINSEYVVIHPGFIYSKSCIIEQAISRSRKAIEKLIDVANTLNLTLAIENVGYNGTSLFSMEEYIAFVETFNSENVGYLIDTGHAKINNWNIPMLLDRVSNKLLGLHIHDNHGEQDEHLPVGDGYIKWEEIWEKLTSISFDHPIYLTLEYTYGTPIKKVKRDKDLIAQIFQII